MEKLRILSFRCFKNNKKTHNLSDIIASYFSFMNLVFNIYYDLYLFIELILLFFEYFRSTQI